MNFCAVCCRFTFGTCPARTRVVLGGDLLYKSESVKTTDSSMLSRSGGRLSTGCSVKFPASDLESKESHIGSGRITRILGKNPTNPSWESRSPRKFCDPIHPEIFNWGVIFSFNCFIKKHLAGIAGISLGSLEGVIILSFFKFICRRDIK